MGRRTPLYKTHLAAGAKLIDFSGYDMPISYGSQVAEHDAVRNTAGVFDVSHMLAVDLSGAGARPYLLWLLTNDVDRLKEDGQALYTAMLNSTGGVMDDLIVYRLGSSYRLVLNCSRREVDLAWIRKNAGPYRVDIRPRTDLALLALQGPEARNIFCELFPEVALTVGELRPFRSLLWSDENWQIARTGYTGEDGLEILLPAGDAVDLWDRLVSAGVAPAGLASRDTLRLEAGMNLFGNDMDETVSPVEANMQGALAMEDDRQFIGRKPLESLQASADARVFYGLILAGRGVLRPTQKVYHDGEEAGSLTSGIFSPTLRRGIGFCRLRPGTGPRGLSVDIRGQLREVQAARTPFVRRGKPVFQLFPDKE